MRLSLHMLVLNGEDVVGRAIRSLAGHVDEVVYVDSGSTDGTEVAIKAACRNIGAECFGVVLDKADDGLFFTDEPATWSRSVPGHFTGGRIMRRWDVARNIGLDLCRGDYVVKLDADDEVVDHSGLGELLSYLDADRRCDIVMAPYEVLEGGRTTVTVYDRLWRRKPGIRFDLPIHEYLTGKGVLGGRANWTMVSQGLRVRDWRDSPGDGVRIPYRNYKVWLLEYERRLREGELLDARFLTSALPDVEEADPEMASQVREMAGAYRLGRPDLISS